MPSAEETQRRSARVAESGREAGRAVVVGGAGGIGFGVAEELVRTPWVSEVVLGDIDEAQASLAAARLNGQHACCRAAAIDVTDQQAVDAFAESCGDTEYLVVCAGIFDSGESLTFERPDFERVVAVNLIGAFYCAQRFGRDMAARGSGSIVGVASIAAHVPRFRQAAYSASKAGMRQAYRVLAKDHPSIDDLAAGRPNAFRLPIPLGVVARPQDIAAAAVFLLSPSAAHITLADVVVDGGELLGA